MAEKLKSRKLWVTVGTLVSVFVAQAFDVEIDPAAIVGLAGVIITYIFGQSWVDKNATTAAVTGELDLARAQLLAYARQLEAQLAELDSNVTPLGVEITD